MTGTIHLNVEQGEDRGRQISVTAGGVRLGRSSRNDVVLVDPLLSRHHCRFYFKPDGGLWVVDLGSSNETLVNDTPVQEARLYTGDRVTIGDTLLRVVNDGQTAAPAAPAVDLGLARQTQGAAPAPINRRTALLGLAGLVALLALIIWIPKLLQSSPPHRPAPPAPPEAAVPRTLEIEYEKLEADAENIFRYYLSIDLDGMLAVRIDDIQNDRHVREETRLDEEYLATLTDELQDSGFFDLDTLYQGIQPDMLAQWDLSITIGRQTHRTRVVNRLEPDVFRAVRETIEACGKNELGLWAIQFSAEKLRQMAREAYLLGTKLYNEREVRYENLARAIQHFKEAEWFLQTVEPKPEYYGDIVNSIATCKEALEAKYQDYNFRAERAIRLREWERAAQELRVILESIPDRGDPRNQEARKKLLDVEARINTSR